MKLSNLYKEIRFRKTFKKNFIIIFLMLMIPVVVINMLFYKYNQSVLLNNVSLDNSKIVITAKNYFDNIFTDCDRQFMELYADSTVIECLLNGDPFADPLQSVNTVKNINYVLSSALLNRNYISSVKLYCCKSGYVFGTDTNNYVDSIKETDIIWKIISKAETKNMFLISGKYEELAVVKNIYYNGEYLGAAMIFLNMEEIKLHSFGYSTDSSEKFIIFSAEKEPIFSSIPIDEEEKKLYLRLLNEKQISDKLEIQSEKISGELYTNFMIKSSWEDMIYFMTVPVNSMGNGAKVYRTYMVGTVALSLIFLVILTYIISIETYSPIKKLLELIGQNDMLYNYPNVQSDKYNDEINYIMNNVSNLAEKQKQTENVLIDKMFLLKKYQLSTLQTQIKPHFMYNTIQVISLYACDEIADNKKIVSMLKQFARLLQLTYTNNVFFAPVRDEIEHAKCYLGLQQEKFAEKFDVKWDIDETILNCKVTKICLQPIIENSIDHGFSDPNKKYTIKIRAYREKNSIIFVVSDNGEGMTEEQLEKVRDDINETETLNSAGLHIGLKNVNSRIRLIFGDEYGVSVESVRHKGTEVTLKFPKKDDITIKCMQEEGHNEEKL